MHKLKQIWLRVNSSLWFLPTIMVLLAIALAFALIELEFQRTQELVKRWPRVFGAGADGSRGMLSAIAGSMITVTGVTFSITIVALAMASGQYTPRILRNFMRNRTNQFVLGFFVGVFAYCLVVLRTIRGGDEGEFIPSFAVVGGIALALASVGVLIAFIHHIASSIQADNIIAGAFRETMAGMKRAFPGELGDEEEAETPVEWREAIGYPIPSRISGYVQHVNADGLLHFAQKHKTVLRMERGIGEYVAERSPLVSIFSTAPANDETVARLNGLYTIGDSRTIEQDAMFGVRQIVDIALKALSPGINDPTTAVTCLESLGAILISIAHREMPARVRSDESTVRVIARGPTFARVLAEACDQIRNCARGNAAVLTAMARILGSVARETPSAPRRALLREQIELIAEIAEQSIEFEYDRAQVREAVATARVATDRVDSLGEAVAS